MEIKLAGESDWERYSEGHFDKRENWGDPFRMSSVLMDNLCEYRAEVKSKIKIHCGWADGTGHAENSQHYLGCAADFAVLDVSYLDALRVLLDARDADGDYLFFGIGAYADWNEPGFHADVRQLSGKPRIFWIETVKSSGDYRYFSNSEDFYEAVREVLRTRA